MSNLTCYSKYCKYYEEGYCTKEGAELNNRTRMCPGFEPRTLGDSKKITETIEGAMTLSKKYVERRTKCQL